MINEKTRKKIEAYINPGKTPNYPTCHRLCCADGDKK